MPEPETEIALHPTQVLRLGAMTYPAPAVMTITDVAQATDDLAFIQSVKRGLTAAREETLAPVRARLTELRGAYDRLLDRVTDAETRVKGVLLAWRTYREMENARAAQEAARAQAAFAAAEAQADATAAGLPESEAAAMAAGVSRVVEAEVTAAVGPAPVPRATLGDVGMSTVARTWTFEVIDPALVPRGFLTINETLIRAAIRAGRREIPGVRIYQRESIVGRRR